MPPFPVTAWYDNNIETGERIHGIAAWEADKNDCYTIHNERRCRAPTVQMLLSDNEEDIERSTKTDLCTKISSNTTYKASEGNLGKEVKETAEEIFSPPAGSIDRMPLRKTQTHSGKSYGGLAEAVDAAVKEAYRRTSGGPKRIMSGDKKLYMHPDDRIWEDPPDRPIPAPKLETVPEPVKPAVTPVQPPSYVRKNPFARVRMRQEARLEHSASAPVLPVTKYERVEVQRNPPSRSRNPCYTRNESLPPTPPSSRDERVPEPLKGKPIEDGKEIRSDDIRAATSKQRKDRSPNLPQPTMVSNKPGRPIVSFKPDWKPKEVLMEEVRSTVVSRPPKGPCFAPPNTKPSISRISTPERCVDEVPKPPIPTIVIPDDPAIPSIVLPYEPEFANPAAQSMPTTPAIRVRSPTTSTSAIGGLDDAPPLPKIPAQRPLPSPTRPGMPPHAATAPLPKSTPHYTPSVSQSGALCAHCALPIAGRILSAAGQRFHPNCFVCHQCNTNLELVACYPEPEIKRAERLDRIHARQAGSDLPIPEGMTKEQAFELEVADGDLSLRFYCHLDFHELFSPRCKSCKTPIEGEIVVACGAEWHVGHFFCAQCGDPFDSSMPFVEKDGYAWCVGCHTNRYSSKCKKCRQPVTELVVKALGADWHDKCFVCMECNGDFEDGRYFLRGDSQDPVCVKCEEIRLKA